MTPLPLPRAHQVLDEDLLAVFEELQGLDLPRVPYLGHLPCQATETLDALVDVGVQNPIGRVHLEFGCRNVSMRAQSPPFHASYPCRSSRSFSVIAEVWPPTGARAGGR